MGRGRGQARASGGGGCPHTAVQGPGPRDPSPCVHLCGLWAASTWREDRLHLRTGFGPRGRGGPPSPGRCPPGHSSTHPWAGRPIGVHTSVCFRLSPASRPHGFGGFEAPCAAVVPSRPAPVLGAASCLPAPPRSVEKCLPRRHTLVPGRLGTAGVLDTSPVLGERCGRSARVGELSAPALTRHLSIVTQSGR